MNKFQAFVARKKAEYGDKFDVSDLAPEFVEAFNSGQRIKVDFVGLDANNNDTYGHSIKSGTVSVTTGWKPSFMLILTKRSTGSCWLLSSRDREVRA